MRVLSAIPFLALLATAAAGPASETVTDDPGAVAIESVRIVLDRKDSHIRVQQSFQLRADKGRVFSGKGGYAIPLPEGAWGPNPVGDEDRAYEVFPDRIVVLEPISSRGQMVTISFNLPIENSTMVLNQKFGVAVVVAEVYSKWTEGPVKLTGRGFAQADYRELNNGLLVLFAMARNIEDGQLTVTLSQLPGSVQRIRALWTMGVSIAVLIAGLFVWLRRRRQSADDGAA